MVTSQQQRGGLRACSPQAARFIQAQAGCSESLNRLMARHDGLVQAVVRQQGLGELAFEEALQAGRIGLWRAILGFDPLRGYAFSTYAWACIKHHVWRAVKAHQRLLEQGQVSGQPSELPDPALVCEEEAVQGVLLAMVERLPARLAYVITARYGLNGHPPSTYRQIGTALGLSAERARQLHGEALARLRHPAHSYQLRSCLDAHTLAQYEQADDEVRRWLHRRGGRHA